MTGGHVISLIKSSQSVSGCQQHITTKQHAVTDKIFRLTVKYSRNIMLNVLMEILYKQLTSSFDEHDKTAKLNDRIFCLTTPSRTADPEPQTSALKY